MDKETFTKEEIEKLKTRFNGPSPEPWRILTKEQTETLLKHSSPKHDTVMLETRRDEDINIIHKNLKDIMAITKRILERNEINNYKYIADTDSVLIDGVKVLNTLYAHCDNPTLPGFSTEISCTIEGEKISTCIGLISYVIDQINTGNSSKYCKAEYRHIPKKSFNLEVDKFVVLLSTPAAFGYYDKEIYFNPKTKKIEVSDVSESWR